MTPTEKIPSSPALPWKTRVSVAAISALTDACRRSDGTVNRRLLSLLDFKAAANSKPVKGVKSRDITLDPARNIWIRVFVPTVTDDAVAVPVIVFFHGGGFVYLSPDGVAYDAVCRRIARKVPAIVVSVNYRLAPEHQYPAQYEDGFDVLRFLDEDEKGELLPGNADVSNCFLAGDSAGGNLAHHVAKKASESAFRKLKVTGLVAIQPFFGGEERTEAEKRLANGHLVSTVRTDFMWKAFMPPGEGDRDHEVINVSGPRAADLSQLPNFPPTMVVVAGFDALQDWQRRYYEWLKKCGKEAKLVEYPNMIHAFYIFPELPEASKLIGQLKDFIHTHKSPPSIS